MTVINLSSGDAILNLHGHAGAHTVGRTSCAQIVSRLYNFPGSSNGVDPALDVDYARHLQQVCPQNGNPSVAVPLDPVSPNTFDNMYYTNGVTGRVMFASDNALFLDHQTEFASNLNSQNGAFWQVCVCTERERHCHHVLSIVQRCVERVPGT